MEKDQKALFSIAIGLADKTAEHDYCPRISDKREVLQ
jgi:hypothetical protein